MTRTIKLMFRTGSLALALGFAMNATGYEQPSTPSKPGSQRMLKKKITEETPAVPSGETAVEEVDLVLRPHDHQQGTGAPGTRSGQGSDLHGQLRRLRRGRHVRRHRLSPRDSRVHDSGGWVRAWHDQAGHEGTHQERVRKRAEEHARDPRDGPDIGSRFRDEPVLHQCQGQPVFSTQGHTRNGASTPGKPGYAVFGPSRRWACRSSTKSVS